LPADIGALQHTAIEFTRLVVEPHFQKTRADIGHLRPSACRKAAQGRGATQTHAPQQKRQQERKEAQDPSDPSCQCQVTRQHSQDCDARRFRGESQCPRLGRNEPADEE
jgi:hypothetical protein